jgi:hypothetical protein
LKLDEARLGAAEPSSTDQSSSAKRASTRGGAAGRFRRMKVESLA